MAEAQPAPATILFARGVIAILNTWPVLRLAVEQAWGGPESAAKRRWLAGAIVDAFESAPAQSPDAPYIEEMLLQILQDEFDVEVDDESGAEVARQIVQLWPGAGGDVQLQQLQSAVDALEATEQRARGKKIVAQQAAGASDEEWDDTDDESDDAENGDEPPQLVDRRGGDYPREEPEVDDEGFTVVKRGNRSAR